MASGGTIMHNPQFPLQSGQDQTDPLPRPNEGTGRDRSRWFQPDGSYKIRVQLVFAKGEIYLIHLTA
jgi:hypothetical protein